MQKILKPPSAFIIIYLVVLVLYYPALSTFFSHDDFFHFKVSLTDGSLKQFINFFGFHPFSERQIAFYRPIFREVLYNLFYNIFGLNQLPFRILSFLVHFTNLYLTFVLIQKLFHNKFISLFSSFFFAVTAANVAPFYYLAGGIQTQGATTFILLTLIFFVMYLEKTRLKFKFLYFLTFLLAIASHEQATVLPILLAGIILIKYPLTQALKKIFYLWPLFLVVGVYAYLNVTVIGYSSQETQYKMNFNPKTILQTFSWYSIWALGVPETLQDFLLPGFRLNPSLMRYWGNYYRIIFPVFGTSILIISIYTTLLLIRRRKVLSNKIFLYLLFWFPLGFIPAVFLPQHKSTHYLYPSLPAFWGVISYLVYNGFILMRKKYYFISNFFLIILFISLTILSATSAIHGKKNYWAAQRGKLAAKLINEVKSKYPNLSKSSIIYFKNDPGYPHISGDWGGTSKQAYFALNGEDALQLLYKDPTLRVFYEDLGGIPPNFPKDNTIVLTAHI